MDYMIHYDHFEKYIPVSGDVSYDISTKDHFRILLPFYSLYSVQFSSITQSCPTLCDPMNYSMPGLAVHQLLEFTQTHVH